MTIVMVDDVEMWMWLVEAGGFCFCVRLHAAVRLWMAGKAFDLAGKCSLVPELFRKYFGGKATR